MRAARYAAAGAIVALHLILVSPAIGPKPQAQLGALLVTLVALAYALPKGRAGRIDGP